MKFLGQTLLGSITPEQEAAMERDRIERERRAGKLQLLAVEIWLEGYKESEIDLGTLCRRVRDVAVAQGLSDKMTEAWIGHVALAALRVSQTRRPRSNGTATALKRVAYELVEHASREWGAPKNRVGGKGGTNVTAYQLAADALKSAGVEAANARLVERWSQDYPQSRNVGDD